ncbi:MAG: EF-hand domain-containing protein [Phycisphaerales bacterium]
MNCMMIATTLTAATMLAGHATAQPYTIPSSTIDGGGGTLQGTTYTLSGTIGQPDAGLLTGASYSLSGGFWFAMGPACVADCDGSGTLNIDDIDCFIDGFLSSNLLIADCDGNGTLNIDDIDCFVQAFLAGCP